jgi:hypothetical protein
MCHRGQKTIMTGRADFRCPGRTRHDAHPGHSQLTKWAREFLLAVNLIFKRFQEALPSGAGLWD